MSNAARSRSRSESSEEKALGKLQNLFLIMMMFQASQSRDRLDLKILPGLNYSHGFEISTDLKTWVAATWLLSSRTPTSTMRSRFITYLKRCAKFFLTIN